MIKSYSLSYLLLSQGRMKEPDAVITLPVHEDSFGKKKRLKNIVVINPKKRNKVLPFHLPTHATISGYPDPPHIGTSYKPKHRKAWEGDFEREDLFSQINASTAEILQDFDDSDLEEISLTESNTTLTRNDDGSLIPTHILTNVESVSSTELQDRQDNTITEGTISNDVITTEKTIPSHLPQIAWDKEQRKGKEKRNKKRKVKNTQVHPISPKNTETIGSIECVETESIEWIEREQEKLPESDDVSGLGDCEVYENTPKLELNTDELSVITTEEVTDLKTRLLNLRTKQTYQPQKIAKKFDIITLLNQISLPDRPAPPYASQFPHRLYTVPCPDYKVEESVQYQMQVFSPDELLMREVLEDGLTPLHVAAKLGQLHQIHLLISTGADVNAVDRHGRIPLMLTFNEQLIHMDCVQTLVNDSSFLNQQVTDGATTLHMACYLGHYNLVEYLLAKGADARISDGEGRLPIHWATHPYNPKSIQYIVNRHPHILNATDDANMTPLMWAAYHNQIACVSLLLSLGAEVEEKDVDGKTANHWAVHTDNAKCLRRLLKLESTFFKDHKGKTVLHEAAEMGSIPAMKAVLSLRRDAVCDVDKLGRTPLHWAAVSDQVEACKYLLDRGADAGQTDNNEKTALDYALMKGHNYTVALFTCHETSVIDLSRSLQQDDVISTLSTSISYASFNSRRATSALSRATTRSSVSSRFLPPQSRVYTTIRELEVLAYGCDMGVYEFGMQGALHRVYMWLDISTSRVCWGRGKKSYFSDNFKASPLKEVTTETSKEERERCDRDIKGQKYFLFKIETQLELMFVVAFNELAFSAWTDQLAKYLLYSPRSLVGLKRFLI
ncbi:Ankyrin repeat domain-containing protein 55-like [Oopsacas minuta]|uniref:Ankyrin repeat domain-containing protein 55-like n=1 Tax=Oopsacas minuta TaxID=111878 RepID=A0AAV7KGU9_9METZ|nr:Ankyrin repeat domain-containing protein 55-like [Oopsacas minuta]